MPIVVSLRSEKMGEIRKFLQNYFEKPVYMDEDVEKWIYVYKRPMDAVDIISTVIDNNDKYDMNIYVQLDNGVVHPVTYENHNDIIKGIICLFYEEKVYEAI
jgi:hypothetical protein